MSTVTHVHAHDGHTHDGHTHDGHAHDRQGHGSLPEAGIPPAGGPVVVDIGGDVGALIVTTDRSWLGRELHVRRDGETCTTHTGVWERRLGDRPVVVAVFAQLVEGEYSLLDATGQPMVPVVVTGGRITELDLEY